MKSHTFDDNGYLLPDEVTDITWDNFEEIFIFNHQRAELALELKEFVSTVTDWRTDTLQIWVDGSFVTLKPHPNDIDLICFVDNVFYESNLTTLSSIKAAFSKLDIYFIKNYPKEHPRYFLTNFDKLDWLHFLTRDRQNRRKGIVNLLLS
ncbi:DUF6932 family protein [Dyadobacter jiangsuensis]|uniref:Nucleotidyltransferase-like protein n=1 Tax=Dyadobacter jiangsuensis TaxID=1591085 RepID=A0A2P8FVA5_9BACT|nr:hypothetical protein [Dyadobacter jiangsuensis]PSL25660.1 hypothetical protein CLV60_111111 [Dyadobacter jiangsuensis]